MELPRSHGRRPLSLDLIGDEDTTIKDILDIFAQNTTLTKHKINLEAAFQIGKDTFNLTMINEEAKNALMAEGTEFYLHGKKYLIQAPRTQPSVVNIRAVPSEASNLTIAKAIDQYQAGNIVGIRKQYHKGTNLHNGYRTIAIAEYKPGKLPAFIKIDGAFCKVFEPTSEKETMAEKKCHKCSQPGHLAANCKVTICSYCREQGHQRTECEKLNVEFPAIEGAKKITENHQKQKPVTQEERQEDKLEKWPKN